MGSAVVSGYSISGIMENAIYVLLDHRNGRARRVSLETLALAQKMSVEGGLFLHPVILGDNIRPLVEQVKGYRTDSVLMVEDPKLAEYDPDFYCEALMQILKDKPQILLMGHTYQNIDFAPKLAAAMNKALLTDCVGYRWDGNDFLFIRQMFRNKLNAEVNIESERPWIVTVQTGAFTVDELREGRTDLMQRSVNLSAVTAQRKNLRTFEVFKGKVDLAKARVIVSVGRGIKKAENMKIVEELAEVLGAEITGSRPVVDNEWLERDRQIGSSGQTVFPRLYIACGISGAIQHIIGMKNSTYVVAINRDPNAPIFGIATYGIVGDLFEIIPALTRELRKGADL